MPRSRHLVTVSDSDLGVSSEPLFEWPVGAGRGMMGRIRVRGKRVWVSGAMACVTSGLWLGVEDKASELELV